MSQNLLGIGLKAQHYHEVIESQPKIDWFEVHSENFFDDGGYTLKVLDKIRETYDLSLHGVGLSLGTADPLDKNHLTRLKALNERYRPFLISEHLSWGHIGGVHVPDLLPIPYTEESLEITCEHIDQAQNYLGRQLLLENPSTYLTYSHSEMREEEFIVRMLDKSGCKLLLDVNNVYVSAMNHGFDPFAYLDAIPIDAIGEIHVAGHTLNTLANGVQIRVDTHDNFVCDEVVDLYKHMLRRGLAAPLLLEWDEDVPSLQTLVDEVLRVRDCDQKKYCA